MKDKKKAIHYVKSEDYQRFYASGFFGGLTSQGDLQFEIYEEAREVPEKSTLIPVDEEKGVYEERFDEVNFERIVHAGLTIPIEVVPGIINWLESKVKEYNEKFAKDHEKKIK